MTIAFLLLVAAFIAFVLAALSIPSRVSLLPLGLALWVASLLVQHFGL